MSPKYTYKHRNNTVSVVLNVDIIWKLSEASYVVSFEFLS